MPDATSAMPPRLVLDWRHGTIGPLASCVLCGTLAISRSPVKGVPCHKCCAEQWITDHARDAGHLARLIRLHTPVRGGVR